MAQIRIDADKEERMIAQILRDEKKLLPAEANALATNICRRLTVAIPTPTNLPLQGYRIIRSSPPDGGDEFIAAHAEHARCHAVPSNLVASVGSSLAPIAGFQFALNAPSSVAASVTMVALQVGVG